MFESLLHLMRDHLAALSLLFLLGILFVALRTKGTRLEISEFDARLRSGQPTVVEFFSNT